MDLTQINPTLYFDQDENGVFYKNIDGFLYSITSKADNAIISINLPEVSRNEKKMITAYIKESVLHYIKSHFVKNGIQIFFNLAILDDPEYILQFAKAFSAYLISASIEFSNTELDVAFDGVMYAYLPIEKPIENTNLRKPRHILTSNEDLKTDILARFSTQGIMIIVYLAIAVLYGLISIFALKIAGAVGYILGWIPAMILVKKGYSNKKIYLWTSIFSLFVLVVATIYVFLFYFLSQQDIYTASEFIMQSLVPANSLFNLALAYVLSIFGAYSTVPAKKKSTNTVDDDFS